MPKDARLQYNERSWAIDLISYINQIVPSGGAIGRASGEHTLRAGTIRLFPDVLIYSNSSAFGLLQGWELKLPDTPIDDAELLDNAEKKARYLGLDSFLVWNGTTANLYILDRATDSFKLHSTPLFSDNSITSRNDIQAHPDKWKKAAHDIIDQLNRFFDGGNISGVSPDKLFSSSNMVEQILSAQSEVKSFIEQKMQHSREIDAKIKLWWKHVEHAYPGENSPTNPLAYYVLLRWFNRFIFSNILRAYTSDVKTLESIDSNTTISDALHLFSEIAGKKRYQSVFERNDFDELLPDSIWQIFIGFHDFLRDFDFSRIDHGVLHSILKSVVLTGIKKTAGLFVTPELLAYFLVLLSLDEKDGYVIDPFCGTGTIINAIFAVKCEANISGRDAVNTTWGSDKFAFPVQIATLAVSTPENMNESLRVFTHDAFEMKEGGMVSFYDSVSGGQKEIPIPKFQAIISNLPFVQFEDRRILNPNVDSTINLFYRKMNVSPNEQLDGRSDLYAYIPFCLYDLLDENGHFGVIVSNSWLSSKWGRKFRNLLMNFFHIEYIVISGNGKWFHTAEVVTTLLICQKKEIDADSIPVQFISITEQLDTAEKAEDIATHIIANAASTSFTQNMMTVSQLEQLDAMSIGWTSCFSKIQWLLENADKFCHASDYLFIDRGIRRGWNDFFYPSNASGIESEFLVPLIKNLRESKGYYAESNHFAFSCNKSCNALSDEKKNGALGWIKKFATKVNGTGQPLPDVLQIANGFWYQLNKEETANFVMSMNPDTRLHIAKMTSPSFVDQRLIRFTALDVSCDLDFMHALLNSTFSIYMIESLGFGRGLGVLDINATKIKNGLYIPNPVLFNESKRDKIKRLFSCISRRDVLPVLDELQNSDRITLDIEIARALKFPDSIIDDVYNSFRTLYGIRKAVE